MAEGPPRPVTGRIAVPPRTLPSLLMDDTSPFSSDPRVGGLPVTSPGKQSPGRPKTMKDYEEELEKLQRENFSLKVKIYFMDQNRYNPALPKDLDELTTAFTDLKVEHEIQKKDLAKKEDLLVSAYRALDALKQQREADKRQIGQLHERLEQMQKELKEYHVKFLETSVQLDDTNAMYAFTFGLNNAESKRSDSRCDNDNGEQVKELESNLTKERARVLMLEEKMTSLNERSEQDQERLRSMGDKLVRVTKELEQAVNNVHELEQVKRLDKESQRHQEALETEIDSLKSSIKDKTSKIDSMKAYIKNLEKELELVKMKLNEKEEAFADQRRANEQLVIDLREERKRSRQVSESGSGSGGQSLRSQLDDLQRENRELRKASPDHFAKLLQSCFKQIKKLETDNQRLQLQLQADNQVNSRHSIDSNKSSTSEKDTFIIELLNKIEELTVTLNSREIRLEELKNKMDFSSSKIELEKSKTESDIRALEEKHEKDTLTKELANKQKEVDSLKRELKKKTYNLQGLVNTELWDKNREIEKLNKACERKHLEVMALQNQLREYQASLARETVTSHSQPDDQEKQVLTQRVAELESRLLNMPERDTESTLVRSLRGERDRAVSACLLLTTRLRELADFLDGLLPALGGRRRKAVQQAVQRSRELSRSVSLAAEESSLVQNSVVWSELQPSLCVSLLPDISAVDFWSGDEDNTPPPKSTFLDTSTFADEFSVNVADLLPEGTLVDVNTSAEKTMTALPDVKSANIGKITLTSRKKVNVSQQEAKDGVSDYETWSEPDRDVSYARMGLRESPSASAGKPPLFKFEETSETADSTQKSPGRRASETQRLHRKVQNLEQVNEALRSELLILHQLTPVAATQDKATSIELARQSILSVPTHLLEEIRNQREKLEASLFHNDYIRRQLETAISSLKKNQGGAGGDDKTDKTSSSKLKEITKQLEVAENQILLLKSEKDEWNRKIEMMETTIQQTSKELMDKQCALSGLENQASQRVKDLEQKCSEKCARMEQKYVELENKWLSLERERDQLLERIAESNRHATRLAAEIDASNKENRKNKKLHEELNFKLQQISRQKDDLQRVVSEQEQLMADAEREREELATQLIARDRQVESAEAAGRELEAALRGQLDAATSQCAHFEARLRDADYAHKQLARMKGELERRVAELEAVNCELETRLTGLDVKQVYSDCDTDGGPVLGSPSRRPPPPLSLPPLSQDLTSDYLSEPDAGLSSPQCGGWAPLSPHRNHSQPASSPDLGIESDLCRFSSLDSNKASSAVVLRGAGGGGGGDLVKLEEENSQLRRNLQKTRHALEETLAQLTAANQHKRHYEAQLTAVTQHKAKVERAICRQINKTHSILKKAKVNLEQEAQQHQP